MIPKVIHYCWFGRGQLPDLAQKCIASWKTYLPDYKMKLWNEDTFNVNSIPYVKEAYEAGKYAFVTDYVRLFALYNIGGIYMDTDVEILKSLDDLLHIPAFSGFEGNKHSSFPTGIMASVKGGVWAKEQLEYYDDIHFINSDGIYNMTTNTQTISRIMGNNGFALNGKYQVYKNEMHAFPQDYFCPKSSTGIITLTQNTYCIHHFAGSWINPSQWNKFKQYVSKYILGVNTTDTLVQMKRKWFNK